MTTIREKYTSVKINTGGITISKDDGTTAFIPISDITEFSFVGAIAGVDGDQSFFDEFDQDNSQPLTDIVTIAKFWKRDFIDFSKARDQMYIAIATKGGFNNLNDFEKSIAARWFLASYDDRITVITIERDKINWDFIVKYTKIARDRRIEKTRKEISYTLYPEHSDDLFNSVGPMITAYSIANKKELINWFNNLVGSPYENDGFMQKEYFSQELLDMFNAVIVNGDYTD